MKLYLCDVNFVSRLVYNAVVLCAFVLLYPRNVHPANHVCGTVKVNLKNRKIIKEVFFARFAYVVYVVPTLVCVV